MVDLEQVKVTPRDQQALNLLGIEQQGNCGPAQHQPAHR
jgi:hypothetical protein